MISFPSIEQFRHAIREVSIHTAYVGKDASGEPIYDGSKPKPKLKYRGTVKLHGTNAAVVRLPDGKIQCQSRTNVLNADKDNYGFAKFALETVGQEVWNKLFEKIIVDLPDAKDKAITLYGEWCGGNIQSGVALSQLERMFVIFALRVGTDEETVWVNMGTLNTLPASPEHRIFNVLSGNFATYEMDIDFNNPALIQNDLIAITTAVEQQCPIGKAFGAEGVGEGVVWTSITPGWESSRFWFKVKGEKHSSSKVKTLAAVDVEKVKSQMEFAEKVITESRCKQGLEYLKSEGKAIDQKSTGPFLKWVYADVMKEESDTLAASGLDESEVGKAIGTHARNWYFGYLAKEAGL